MSTANAHAADTFDIIVIGAGPAGVFAALRAADLGARTVLVTSEALGGMAANDGPVPVRTLAHAARLVRDARELQRYGIAGCEPTLDYTKLLDRVGQVVDEVSRNSALRPQLEKAGVAIFENVGPARFSGPGEIVMAAGHNLRADRIILCTGGVSRRPTIPGIELTATHSDAWSLRSVPETMLVIGGGATGMQVASVFNAFGTHVTLFEVKNRVLVSEDEDFAAAVAHGFAQRGINIVAGFGTIDRFASVADGVAMHYSKDGEKHVAVAGLVVAALGWVARTGGLNLSAATVETDDRGFVKVDQYLRTTAPGIYAAGDITGQRMLAPQAIHQGIVASENALADSQVPVPDSGVAPMGSFTDPEYAQVGMNERQAHQNYDVVVAVEQFESLTRAIIDGQTDGFCKLVADRNSGKLLGCQVVGERAVDIVQLAAVAMAAGMKVNEFARIPFAFPTYASVLARASLKLVGEASNLEGQQIITNAPIAL